MDNAALILQLLITAGVQIQNWSQIVANAKAEGRDVSDEELNSAVADYKAAHDALDKALGK
jgi:hypothetical protein